MLYTQGFLLAGTLAAAITLAAIAELPSNRESEPAVGAGDLDALQCLATAVDARDFRRDRLDEPDFDIAGAAHDAAQLADGRLRAGLLRLADAASRSTLGFLVDYNLAAGRWEARTGLQMPMAAPAPL